MGSSLPLGEVARFECRDNFAGEWSGSANRYALWVPTVAQRQATAHERTEIASPVDIPG